MSQADSMVAQDVEIGGQSESVRLEGVVKRFGRLTVLHRIALSVADGEFVTLLGPSGSGKTTILNLIAGMQAPSEGRVLVAGHDMSHVPIHKRGIGMVFQNYALMPHMTVGENVAFPLRVRRVSKAEISMRVAKALDLVQLSGYQDRLPAELSGGQRQRVAIARCIVYDPKLILMDEPLGALDKKLRDEMQIELKDLHRRLGKTMLYVTHDQDEAVTMSDRIVLLNNGRIEQLGAPNALYYDPASLFAAQFIGESNHLVGTALNSDASIVKLCGGKKLRARPNRAVAEQKVDIVVRPECATIRQTDENRLFENCVEAVVKDTVHVGGSLKVFTELDDGSEFLVRELASQDQALPEKGERVSITWSATNTLVFPSA